MALDPSQPWHLQLMGRAIDGGPLQGPMAPVGARVFLQPGSFSNEGCGLGLTNQALVPLPAELFRSSWLLEAYELWNRPEGGQCLHQLQLSQPLLLHELRLEALPPCAIQPQLERQPWFNVSTLERNPCPAWAERVHLYQDPGQPFQATAVIYLDNKKRVAAAELFNPELRRPAREEHSTLRRCWIQYLY